MPGVQVQFHGERLPAARCTKQASSGWKAFVESARPRSGDTLVATPAALRFDQPRQPARVAVLPLFPGIDGATLRGLAGSGVQGLVLECYGSGTGPADDADFLAALAEWRAAGVPVVALSQGARGTVELGTYAAGSGLADAGVISGRGMTREAALGKLHSLLGCGLERAAVAEWIGRNLCEEL
jgi:L-asparaginase